MKKVFLTILSVLILSLSLNPTFAADKVPDVNILEHELKPDFLPSVTDIGLSKGEESTAAKTRADKKTQLFIGDLIVTALQFLGAAIVLLIIIYALKMILAFGNEEGTTEAKKALGNLFLGLFIIMLSYSITLFILELTLIPQEIEADIPNRSTSP